MFKRNVIRIVFIVVLFFIYNTFPLFSNDVQEYKIPEVRSFWHLLSIHWKINTIYHDSLNKLSLIDETKIKNLVNDFKKLEDDISNKIIDEIKVKDYHSIKLLNKFYRKRNKYEQPVFTGIYKNINNFISGNRVNDGDIVYYPDQTYLPGYGTTDPDYLYARTDTLETRLVGNYWDHKIKKFKGGEFYLGSVEVSVIPKLKKKVDYFVEKSKPFDIVIKNKIVTIQIVSFKVKKSIQFGVYALYNIYRSDFELWRAYRTYVLFPKWEKCGKTYILNDKFTKKIIINVVH